MTRDQAGRPGRPATPVAPRRPGQAPLPGVRAPVPAVAQPRTRPAPPPVPPGVNAPQPAGAVVQRSGVQRAMVRHAPMPAAPGRPAVQRPVIQRMESSDDGWQVAGPKPKPSKAARPPLTVEELARRIADRAISEFNRVFSWTGPTLRVSELGNPSEIAALDQHAVRMALRNRLRTVDVAAEIPGQGLSSTRHAIWSTTGQELGKGDNFNIRVGPNGGTAMAQIHVVWD